MTNQADLALSGPWRNQLGSLLTLRASSDGRLEGFIESKVGGAEGTYPVTGFWQSGEQGEKIVGFVVAWPPTQSVTSWCGRLETDDGTISAMWMLTEQSAGANQWQARRIGNDTFVREPSDLSGEGGSGRGAPERTALADHDLVA